MNIKCPSCHFERNVPEASLRPGKTYKVTCPRCSSIFHFSMPEPEFIIEAEEEEVAQVAAPAEAVAPAVSEAEKPVALATPAAPARTCDGCGACLEACPTGILAGKGCECLSELTQRKGELAAQTVALMKKVGTVWGCDECQRACPYNSDPAVTPIEYFHRERLTRVSLSDINAMSDEEFSRRAYAWRGRKVIVRNLEAVGDEI